VCKGFSIAGRVAYSANIFLKIKTVCLHVDIPGPEMPSFSKYFYDKPLPKCLDPKTVLIYRPHPVEATKPHLFLLKNKPSCFFHSWLAFCTSGLPACVQIVRRYLQYCQSARKKYCDLLHNCMQILFT
jgi:hypothetical protein